MKKNRSKALLLALLLLVQAGMAGVAPMVYAQQSTEESAASPAVSGEEADPNATVSLPPFTGNTADAFQKSFTYYQDVKAMLIAEPTTGKILIEKNSDVPMGIASMSKLMTYWIAKKEIREGKRHATELVPVSAYAATFNIAGSSNYGLKQGDQLPLERMLFGMMVVSGNDAATAIAEHLAGSETAFAMRMTEEARALGMEKTTFVNANGFTVDGKYNVSTARDMFLLSAAILRNFPEVKEYAKVDMVREPDRKFEKESTLSKRSVDIPGMTGLKTGSTAEAGNAFAGSFELKSAVDGSPFEAITVVMGASTNDARWRTTKELVDLAAGSFTHVQVVDASVPVERYAMKDAKSGSVVLYPARTLSVFTFANKPFQLQYKIDEKIAAPTPAEQVFGTIHVYQDGVNIAEVPIVAHEPTERVDLWTRVQRSVEGFVGFLMGLL